MQEYASRRRYLALTGAVAVGSALTGCGDGDGDGATPSPTPDPTTPTPTDAGSDRVETDAVDMTDDLTFDPAAIRVTAGTEVTWTTVGTIGHTVTAYADELPEGATYFASGGYESESAATAAYTDNGGGNVPADETYAHTFETPGTFGYYCIPHELNGMVGSVDVV